MRAKRTDKSQAEIVRELRKRGVQVIVTNFGNDFPDLLCGRHGQWFLIEIKEKDGDLSRGQLEFLAEANGYTGVATDADEAFYIIEAWGHLSRAKQVILSKWLIRNPSQQSLSVKKFTALMQIQI